MRLSHLGWMLIVAAAVAGELVIRLGQHDRLEQFVAPVQDVPAFHVLSAADVRPLWRPAAEIPRGAMLGTAGVVGHVTMTALAANQPITLSELGPEADGRRGGLTVVGIPATAAMTMNGRLTPGETVDVLAAGGAGRYIRVLVLSLTRSGAGSRPYVLLVAIPPRTPRKVVAALGSGTVTLVTQPAP
jgi:flagella basal body P-ring formation protein FlgA